MKRDLVFFTSGIAFGVAAGYFLFRTLAPQPASGPAGGGEVSQTRPPLSSSSSIGLGGLGGPGGLGEATAAKSLDEVAVRKLEARAEENPRDPRARAELGRRYMDAGRFSEALVWLEEAASLDADDLHVRNHLAIAYLNLGRVEDAVATYEGTLAIDPRDPASLLGLGRIKLYIQQDIRGGLAMWETLVSVAPESAEARSVRDELEALKSAHSG